MDDDQPQKTSLLAQFFGLHPLDAYEYSLNIQRQLQHFIDAFKERIEVEINYSKSLFKISKQLIKYIQPENPSPLSYICSAFKVENQQRARHALQLAQYLHTEIEVVCQTLLQAHETESKKLERDLKQYYKQGEIIEQSYQKNLKRYFNSKHNWEDKMINKSILFYTPGVAQSHKDKMTIKLQEEKRETDASYNKYLDSLEVFNRFAQRYNEQIQKIMISLEQTVKKEVMVESDCLRKLIVSEISMFKNIEYDMLNISKQMEGLNLHTQIELFVNQNKRNFVNPILTVYKEGPILENSYRKIDYKYPINRTLMEETLVRIQNRHFDWILYNKKNSTLKYALERIWKSMDTAQKQEDTQYMKELEDIVKNNMVVRDLNVNNEELRQQKLRPQQAYSISLQILHNIGYLCRKNQQSVGKVEEKIQLLRSYFSIHHFYRFIALLFLQEYQNQHDNKIQNVQIVNRYVQITLAVLNESFNSRDIFVVRGIIAILFASYWEEDGQTFYLFEHSDIIENQIWENIDLWEAVVFEASYELISLLPSIQRIQLREVYLMRQKNVIFSGLMAYTRYMIMLGLQSKEVKRILGRYCQIYNLYQEHDRDLIKAIHESEKQYKKSNTSK